MFIHPNFAPNALQMGPRDTHACHGSKITIILEWLAFVAWSWAYCIGFITAWYLKEEEEEVKEGLSGRKQHLRKQ